MSREQSFGMPGGYPGESPEYSDEDTFDSGTSGGNYRPRTLEVVERELSFKKAQLETLPRDVTDPAELEILHVEILSLQEEFNKLTMDEQSERHLARLLQDHNDGYPPANIPLSNYLPHDFGSQIPQESLMPPRPDSARKRGFSQVDHSPQDNHFEQLRRQAGAAYMSSPPLYSTPGQYMPVNTVTPSGPQTDGNSLYLPYVQAPGPSYPSHYSEQQDQLARDAEIARALQTKEVIDLTGDDKAKYDTPQALMAAVERLAPSTQYARANVNPYNHSLSQNTQWNAPHSNIKPEPNAREFGDWTVFKEEPNGPANRPFFPPSNIHSPYAGTGGFENPVVIDDDDDDDDNIEEVYIYGPRSSQIPQFNELHQPFPQTNLQNPPHIYGHGFNPNIPYSDPRYNAKDEQEDVKKLLEHLSEDTESKKPSDRIQTPPELNVKLMEHQKIGLTWLVKQEESGNKGGILADDMGLGKTIQALALIVHRKSSREHHKTTLIICPVSLMAQWQREMQVKVKEEHALATYIYHGTQPKKYKDFHVLKKFDVVFTSYGTLAGEYKKKQQWIAQKRTRFPSTEFPFLSNESTWYRVILDESQHIKNHRTQASKACADLMATYRLCLSGTPMQNNIDDLFGAVRFLHLPRYHDYRDWNKDFGSKIRLGRSYAADAMRRLQTLIKAIMLRRKKDSLIDGKPLLTLPPKTIDLIYPIFSPDEQDLYNAVEQKVQLRFNRYIESNAVLRNYTYVLLLLLRLRQVCCHPKMIKDLSIRITPEEKALQESILHKMHPLVVERLKAGGMTGCPICMDPDRFVKIVLPCGHYFCQECLSALDENARAAMVNGDEGLRCPTCRGPLDMSQLVDWEVFQSVHMPEDGDELKELDNVLGGAIANNSDSDSDSSSDSDSDSDDSGSDLDDFLADDDEIEYETDRNSDSEDEVANLRTGGSRFSPVPPTRRIKQEPGSSRQNGIKKEEDSQDSIFNSLSASSDGPYSDPDFPADIPTSYNQSDVKTEVKSEIKDEVDRKFDIIIDNTAFSKSEGKGVKEEKIKKEKVKKGKKVKTESDVKKGKKPVSRKPRKPKKKKDSKKVMNLSNTRALAVRNKKARKKYFRDLAKDWTTSAKIEKVREILRAIRANDPTEKTIVFSSFTSFLDLLQIPLDRDDKFNFERYDGSMSAKDRNEAVLNFTENASITVMLVSLKAGNSGLNLTSASQVILIDPWWNPYVEEQAIDRAHRIGQTRPVLVHRLVIENTVESRILTLQDQKRELISAAMNEEAIKSLNRLSMRDLIYLFTGNGRS